MYLGSREMRARRLEQVDESGREAGLGVHRDAASPSMYAAVTSAGVSKVTRPPLASERSTTKGPPAMPKTSLSIQSRMGLKVTSPGGQKARRTLSMIWSGVS